MASEGEDQMNISMYRTAPSNRSDRSVVLLQGRMGEKNCQIKMC